MDKKIDLEDSSDHKASEVKSKKDDAETTVLHPNLGPRAPTLDEAAASDRMSWRCKSELNISQLSKISTLSFSDRDRDRAELKSVGSYGSPPEARLGQDPGTYTSTPRKPPEDRATLHGDRHRTKSVGEDLGVGVQGSRVMDRVNRLEYNQRNGNYDPRHEENRGSTSSNSSDSVFSKPQPGSAFSTPMAAGSRPGLSVYTGSPQKPVPEPFTDSTGYTKADPGLPRQNSGSSLGSGSVGANIGAYNAMTRQTSAGPGHNSTTNTYSANAAAAAVGPNLNRSISSVGGGQQRPANLTRPVSVAEMPFKPMSAASQESYQGNSSAHPPQRQLPQRPENSGPYSASSSRNPNVSPEREIGSQYNPNNVRSLSQQVNTLQQQKHQDFVDGYAGVNSKGQPLPVPPPRRTRPMSAGPLRSSSNSAFSIPPQRSLSPDMDDPTLGRDSRATSMPPEHNTARVLPNRQGGPPEFSATRQESMDSGTVRPKIMSRPDSQLGSGRTLPQTPGDKSKQARPGSTPPRPQGGSRLGGGDGQAKPNSVWYEYGCV